MSDPIDLHCHSTVSDGMRSPQELVTYAAEQGIKVLALTDHDNLGGLAIARQTAERYKMQFIDGVEISVTWKKRTIHIVGLKIDPNNVALNSALNQVYADRDLRAQQMGEGLAKVGIFGAYEAAKNIAKQNVITRVHFARFLVESGHAKDTKSVFKNF